MVIKTWYSKKSAALRDPKRVSGDASPRRGSLELQPARPLEKLPQEVT